MNIEPLEVSHQSLIESKFKALNLQLSEYTFANLFLFRKLHNYQVIKINEDLFVRGITRDGAAYLMLTSHPQKISRDTLLEAASFAEIVYPIPESWISDLEGILSHSSFKDEDSDYLFSSSKFAYYPGRHLSKKRNLVKQLHNQHQVIIKDLTPSLIPQAHVVLEEWLKEKIEEGDRKDGEPCAEALHNFEKLHLHGRLIYLDNYPSGFTIGEWVSKDCYVVHFSKARSSFHGIYQFLFQDLGQILLANTAWINIEQDLGLPTLRQSKQSYLPDKLLLKWRGFFHKIGPHNNRCCSDTSNS